MLKGAGASPDVLGGVWNSAFHTAVAAGSFTCLDAVLPSDFDLQDTIVHARKSDLWPPLLLASRQGRAEIVEYLLNVGASPNDWLSDGTTALHLALAYKRSEAARLLIRNSGMTIDTINRISETYGSPLEVAGRADDHQLATLLREKGAVDYRRAGMEGTLARRARESLPVSRHLPGALIDWDSVPMINPRDPDDRTAFYSTNVRGPSATVSHLSRRGADGEASAVREARAFAAGSSHQTGTLLQSLIQGTSGSEVHSTYDRCT